jgi:hypothetical protein
MKTRSSAWMKLAAAALAAHTIAAAAMRGEKSPLPMETAEILRAEHAIMERLALAYGSTDWSRVNAFLVDNPSYSGNPNIVFVSLSLANVSLNRFEWQHDIADLERAIERTEWVAANRPLWGERWLSAPLASYLGLTAFRIRPYRNLPGQRPRIERLWVSVSKVLAVEADLRMTPAFPHLPLDSAETGDSKGEENAWEAALLATAANFLPADPRARDWERKARQLAYNALTRPSDPPDAEGVKTTTITEDYQLGNHGHHPNPCYMAATLLLLSQGALTYRLTAQPVPPEFGHNVEPFLQAYEGFIGPELQWTVSADPAGDAGLFPLYLDPVLETRAVMDRLEQDRLWMPVVAADVMEIGEPLWAAVLNAKAVYFTLVGSYLWHSPVPETGARRPRVNG